MCERCSRPTSSAASPRLTTAPFTRFTQFTRCSLRVRNTSSHPGIPDTAEIAPVDRVLSCLQCPQSCMTCFIELFSNTNNNKIKIHSTNCTHCSLKTSINWNVDVLRSLSSTIIHIQMFSHHPVHLQMSKHVRRCKCFMKPHLTSTFASVSPMLFFDKLLVKHLLSRLIHLSSEIHLVVQP